MTNFDWHRRAQDSIAHSALTNSKRPECFVLGQYPTHLKSGDGAYVTDTKGRRYIDFICGLGANLLGYNDRAIREAIEKEARNGISLSLSSTIEVEFAEKFKECFPFVDRIRILKSGSEGCSAAIRIARAATGKEWVFTQGYNGWHDEFTSLTPPAYGVPKYENRKIAKLVDFETLPESTAAVIVEPVVTDYSKGRIEWLKRLRDACDKANAVLIFDETITGLRFPGLSFSGYSGVVPDILVTGKAIAGGMPMSVVAGKSKYMDADYFVSSTFAGERLSIAAAIETLNQLTNQFPIANIWEQASMFMEEFNKLSELVKIEGYPTRGIWKCKDDETRAIFFQESCKAGILVGPSYFWCAKHAEIRLEIIKTFTSVLNRIENGEVKLDGQMPKRPYAEVVRQRVDGTRD